MSAESRLYLNGPAEAATWRRRLGEAARVTGLAVENRCDVYFDSTELDLIGRGLRCRRRVGAGGARIELIRHGVRLAVQDLPDGGYSGEHAHFPPGVVAEYLAERGVPRRALAPIMQIETRRRRYRVELDAGTLRMEIDRFQVRDPIEGPVGRFAEIRLQAEGGEAVLSAVTDIAAGGAAPVVPLLSAVERALWMTGRLPPPPDPQLLRPPREPSGAALTARLRIRFARMQAFAPLAADGIDPEGVHQMRTEIRRLRSGLRAARPWVGASLDFWSGELGALARILGEVRDADVLLMDFQSLRSRPAARDLFRLLEGDRSVARERLLATLDSERYQALVTGFGEYLARAAQHWPGISEFARQTLPRRRRKLVRIASRITADSPDAALHRARIQAKKLRYLIELCLPEHPSARLQGALRATRRLQNLLGRHQDACVAIERFAELGERIAKPRLLEPFVEQAEKRRRKARARFSKRWPACERKLSAEALEDIFGEPR